MEILIQEVIIKIYLMISKDLIRYLLV